MNHNRSTERRRERERERAHYAGYLPASCVFAEVLAELLSIVSLTMCYVQKMTGRCGSWYLCPYMCFLVVVKSLNIHLSLCMHLCL